MRFFFRSRQFRIILIITVILLAVSVICAVIGGKMSPQADALATITAPFRTVASKISNGVSDFISAYKDGDKLMLDNAELETELDTLRKKLVEYDEAKTQNEFYKNYLNIKDKNPSFKFAPGAVISRDKEDPYMGFTINIGTLNGVSSNDPVITDSGLVGYISEAGLTTSKVTTILSAKLTVGALDNRTVDSGIVSGSVELAKKKITKFHNLSRSCNIAVGDYVVTSGEGIFPSGLLIGTIHSIGSDKYNTSIFAEIEPFVKMDELRSVMVITEFEGQGGLSPEGKVDAK